MMMNVICWMVLGLIVGCMAAGAGINNRRENITIDIVLGIAGALAGGLLFRAFRSADVTGFDFWSMAFAVLGSAISLTLWRGLRGSSARA